MFMVDSEKFYDEYHGHKKEHLEAILPKLRESSKSLIWTAGDSSLDNKYWVEETAQAVGAYSELLNPPTSRKDVTYWLNYHCTNDLEGGSRMDMAAINAAVEEATVNERTFRLLPQDKFLRDNISSDDILIVSVGGNDVAEWPTLCTILSMMGMLCLPEAWIRNGTSSGPIQVDDYCCGCGASTLSCTRASPPCMGYFQHLFGTRIQKYIEKLTTKTKPKKILVCTIYYPDETVTKSWASFPLLFLGYNRNPGKLQMLIQKSFETATSAIEIEGTEVIAVPLYEILNGKHTEDYVERVEPSSIGGEKMSKYFLNIIDDPSIVAQRAPVQAPTEIEMTKDR